MCAYPRRIKPSWQTRGDCAGPWDAGDGDVMRALASQLVPAALGCAGADLSPGEGFIAARAMAMSVSRDALSLWLRRSLAENVGVAVAHQAPVLDGGAARAHRGVAGEATRSLSDAALRSAEQVARAMGRWSRPQQRRPQAPPPRRLMTT